jgi:ADP-heptose:LPS heptosyltransferase
MHLAVALRRPTVSIHGPTDPAISGPYGPSGSSVRAEVPCSPCYRLERPADCPLGHTLCQWLITPRMVLDEVREALAILAPPVAAGAVTSSAT